MSENPKMKMPEYSMWNDLVKQDIVRAFQPMFKRGWYVDVNTNKITWDEVQTVDAAMWIHARSDRRTNCDFFHSIFKYLGFIPTWCLNCWKVVARPRNLWECYQLMLLQHDLVENNDLNKEEYYAKCGPEERHYVHGNWGGYFYNRTKSDGFARYKQIRALVDERISKDMPVIFKRFCTEFEMGTGPSWKYEQPKHAKEIETLLEEIVDVPKQVHDAHPEYLKQHNISRWIEWAWDRGDSTVLLFTGGKPLVKPVHTYHKEMTEKDKENLIKLARK